MSEQILTTKQKVVLAAALGTGVVVGATGLVLYQSLNQSVSLSVTGRDFSSELTTLSASIDRLRKDIENLRGGALQRSEERPLKSALKKRSNYETDASADLEFEVGGPVELPSPARHVRSLSQCSSFTNGSSSTEYFSALSSDEEAQEILQNLSYEEEESVSVLNQVDELMEGREDQQEEALNILLDKADELGSNPAYLWRLCKAQYLLAVLAGQAGDSERKKELIMSAVDTGQSALSADEKNSEAHKWFAIALGSRGEFGGVREKILDGFEFKKHIDKAAELNPRDYITHHLLGRFCYEVSQLSWLERKMAATLFAEPPSASLPEAVDHFMKAERMKPEGWKENRLFIAKCYIGQGDYAAAVDWLERADTIPLAPSDYREGIKDRLSQEEITQLLAKYRS